MSTSWPDNAYVKANRYGVLHVGGVRIALESLVHLYDEGYSAESIGREYPTLTLEQIYGALTFFLANESSVRRYISEQHAEWDCLEAEAVGRPDALDEKLRVAREARLRTEQRA